MTLCPHNDYRTITHIKEPKYSTDEILIDTKLVDKEHIIIKFSQCNKYPDWFYMSGKMIRRHRTQNNGRIEVYVVPMSKREEFVPNKLCEHNMKV